jgi:hypothetical protein
MRSVIVCKSRVVKRVQDAGGVFNTGGKQNGGDRGMMGYIYSSSSDFMVQLVLSVNEPKTAQSLSCGITRNVMNKEPRKRFCILGEDSIRLQELFWHLV